MILTAIAYLWGVAERVDRRRAREFLVAPSLRTSPAWLLILLLAAAAVVVHLVSGLFAIDGELGYLQQNFWAVSLLGFLVRDMSILFLVLAGRGPPLARAGRAGLLAGSGPVHPRSPEWGRGCSGNV